MSERETIQRNITRLNFRLIGCVALGYIAVSLLRMPPSEDALDPFVRIGGAIIFMGFGVVMGIITLREQSSLRKAAKKAQEEEELKRLEQNESDQYDDDDYEDDGYEEDDDYEDDDVEDDDVEDDDESEGEVETTTSDDEEEKHQ